MTVSSLSFRCPIQGRQSRQRLPLSALQGEEGKTKILRSAGSVEDEEEEGE